jgi:hypothetical protein
MHGTENGEGIESQIGNQDDLETILILGGDINKNKIIIDNINLNEFLSSFSYLPIEDRLAHKIGSRLSITTNAFQEEEKMWSFYIKIDSVDKAYTQVDLYYEDNLVFKDIEKYKMIFQLCLNGNLEDREFIDKVGIMTERSAWRCSFCGGIFGLTYQDCLEHEKICSKNPDNISKNKKNDIGDFENFEYLT